MNDTCPDMGREDNIGIGYLPIDYLCFFLGITIDTEYLDIISEYLDEILFNLLYSYSYGIDF